MSRRTLAAVGGLAVLAAVAIFLLVGRGGGDGKTSQTPEVGRKASDAPSAKGAAGDRGQGGGGPGGVVLIDDDPAGVLRLEGQVIDAADDPVAGATVVISSNPERTTTTEDDGSFAFDGLVGRPYQIAARAPQGVAGPVTTRLTGNSEPVVLKLRPASSVTVEVVDDAGKPVDGATVELRGLDTQVATTTAGKAAVAPVIPGWYQLAAWAPGFARSYTWLEVQGEATTARVALRKGAPVAGRVVDGAGAPVAGARVTFGGASDWSVQIDERRDGQVTGPDGAFRFDALAAGSVRFDARHPDFAPASSAIVTLDGKTPVDDVEIVLPAGATVSGRVVDKEGAPVASARVRVGVAGAGFVSGPPRQVFSDDGGAFTVRGLPMRALEAAAVADAGASATVPIDASGGDVSGVELVIDVTGAIAGVVVDPDGEPIEGVQVSAGPDFRTGPGDVSQWRLRGFPEALTDAGGAFTLSGLVPGSYRVRASRSQRRRGGPFGGPSGVSVTAEAGDQDVKIVLPVDGGVKGKVVFDDGTVPKSFTVQIAFEQEPFATTDGAFQVDDVSPGEYELDVRGTGFEPKHLTAKVESGKLADLGTITVRKGRTIQGVVTAGGAPVAGATVYAGIQIFGNGTSNKAQFGGPPGGEQTRETTTDEQGHFSLSGFGKRDVYLVAEHETAGRSSAVRLPAGDPAEQDLTIALQPFGSMTGLVKDGDRIAEGQIVSVQSTTAPGVMYGVASGADGVFRLDRLAPDSYKVSAMTGMNPMRGMGFFSKTVRVESGKETKVDVTIARGTISLAAKAQAAGGVPVGGMGWIMTGVVSARNGKDLQLKLAAQGDGFSNFAIMITGQSAVFRELVAGNYTVCLLPLPTGVQGPQAMGYAMRHGDDLPAFCKAVTVAAEPAEQSVTVDVVVPDLIEEE
jgi:protocatechuate 3,4-dioxygenase beta subunit